MDVARKIGRWTNNNVVQIAKVITPRVICSAIELGLRDQRIANVVAGLGWIATGFMMVAMSGVPSLIGACRRKGKSKSSSLVLQLKRPKEKYVQKVALRVGLATCGVCAAIYGVSLLMLAARRSMSLSPPPNCQLTLPDDCNLALVRKELMQCPASRALWQEVEKAGQFSLTCNPEHDAKLSHAWTELETRKIVLNPLPNASPEERLLAPHETQRALFELGNLKRASLFDELDSRVCQLDIEDFARQTETIEWETHQETRQITAQCVSGKFWPACTHGTTFGVPRNLTAGHHTPTLQQALEVLDRTGHTEMYREQWREACRPDLLAGQQAATKSLESSSIYPEKTPWLKSREQLPCKLRLSQARQARICT